MQLVDEVTKHALKLVTDPFGNYVVQYALDLGMDPVSQRIIQGFTSYFASLSANKFSSNVMEKCLSIARDQLRDTFITELIAQEHLPQLLQDQFANYVLQTALGIATPQQFQRMQDAIRPHLHLVRNTPYGKKIESKLNRGNSGGRATHHNTSVKHQGSMPPQHQQGMAHNPNMTGMGHVPHAARAHHQYPNVNAGSPAHMGQGPTHMNMPMGNISGDVGWIPSNANYATAPPMYWG
jgi:hypothetical protein